MSRADPVVKLILLGNGSVGKTSIISRFTDDGFAKVYKQTVGLDFFEKLVTLAQLTFCTGCGVRRWGVG